MKERRLMLIRRSKELIRRSKEFLFSVIKNVLELWVIDCRCKTVNIPKTAEIHTLKWSILNELYLNFKKEIGFIFKKKSVLYHSWNSIFPKITNIKQVFVKCVLVLLIRTKSCRKCGLFLRHVHAYSR